jgi:hypothetical protein
MVRTTLTIAADWATEECKVKSLLSTNLGWGNSINISIVLGHAAPDASAMEAEAQTVLGRI